VQTIAAILAMATASGINAYAALLAMGLTIRLELVPLHSKVSDFFAQDWVLIALGILYLVEFFADKVPVVDHVWDAVHTFIRPIAGAAAAVAIVTGRDEGWVVLAALLGGATALLFHTAKATSRVAVNAASAGTLGWVASLVEDIVAIASALVALLWPALAVLAVIALIATWMLLRRGRRPVPA